MSSKKKQKRYSQAYCECGNKATRKIGSDWECDRCYKLERQWTQYQREENKRNRQAAKRYSIFHPDSN